MTNAYQIRNHGHALRVLVALCLSISMLTESDAYAQQPPVPYVQSNLGLTGFVDGPGIRLRTPRKRGIKAGEFLVWPSLILEGRWDSNVFMMHADDGRLEHELLDAPILRVVPGLAVSNPNPNKFAVSLGAETDIRLYLSSNDTVKKQRNFAAKADLRLDFLPKGAVSFTLYDSFRRKIHTRNFASLDTYNVNTNKASAVLGIHPGGRALDLSLGYAYEFSIYDDFSDLDHKSQQLRLLTTWRFYPKTVALLEVSGQLRTWDREGTTNENVDQSSANEVRAVDAFVDSKPVRSYLGINGFLTKKLSALVKLGYGNSFHAAGASFNHLIAHGELALKFASSALMAVGFQRDFNDSFYGNFYTENRTYLRSQVDIARRVTLDLYADFKLRDFARHDPAIEGVFISHKDRRDQLITGHAKIGVGLTRWVSLDIGYELQTNITEFYVEHSMITNSGIQKFPDYGKYTRHQVYGSVNVQY